MGMTKEQFREKIEVNCTKCGEATQELELCLLGLDVKALFPSMSARRTGEIVRKRMMRSKMKVEGFNWRLGLIYIKMNRHLTSNLGNL